MLMFSHVLQLSILMLAFSMACCLYRLVIGPSVIDRLLVLDTLFLNATCLIVVLGMYWSTAFLFEVALIMIMLGFVSTAALARYFTTGHLID
jgi:multicomponent K+:H+ antiporter subunit F